MTTQEGPTPGLRARDVVAFGQEFGRVLSDGRIVGRAEPFAKVFASSRQVKRAAGVVAWAILEDIALDAVIDVEGRLVAATNVRRISDNLGLATSTVAKHLTVLREYGFVLHEGQRDDGSARRVTSRYVLDPSACVERFTHTPDHAHTRPSAVEQAGVESVGTDRVESGDSAGLSPCRNLRDTEDCEVTTKILLLWEKKNNNGGKRYYRTHQARQSSTRGLSAWSQSESTRRRPSGWPPPCRLAGWSRLLMRCRSSRSATRPGGLSGR